MMHRAKNDWYEYCENLVTGCTRKCPNCYAVRQSHHLSGNVARNRASDQYHKEGDVYILEEPFRTEKGREDRYPFGYVPTIHRYRYRNLDIHKVGSPIFISALGDMFEDWMPEKYINEIFSECIARPQHTYLFMTRSPERYGKLSLPDRDNFWYGTTVAKNEDLRNLDHLPKDRNVYVNFEPLLERLDIPEGKLAGVGWAIIGAERGCHGSKVVPDAAWANEIADLCGSRGIPVFMRPSMLPVMGETAMIRERPESMEMPKWSDRYREVVYKVKCLKCGAEDDTKGMVKIGAHLGRKGPGRNLCCLCRDCYEKWCMEWGMDSQSDIIFKEGGKTDEEELQEDR